MTRSSDNANKDIDIGDQPLPSEGEMLSAHFDGEMLEQDAEVITSRTAAVTVMREKWIRYRLIAEAIIFRDAK
jgi:hypothetical protein